MSDLRDTIATALTEDYGSKAYAGEAADKVLAALGIEPPTTHLVALWAPSEFAGDLAFLLSVGRREVAVHPQLEALVDEWIEEHRNGT